MIEKYMFRPDIILEVTNLCNMACSGCYAPNVLEKNKKAKDHIKHLTLRELEDNWPAVGYVKKVAIRGGEPTLNPGIGKILSFIKGKADEIYLETNGRWLECSTDFLKIIKENKTTIKFSFDKMHGVRISEKNNLLKSLIKENFRLSIAITTNTFDEFMLEYEEIDSDLLSEIEVFWQKKAFKIEDLVSPTFGVISKNGLFTSSVTAKLKFGMKTSLAFLLGGLFLLSPHRSFAKASYKLAIGLASNFSDISSSSSNPFGNYFSDGISLAVKDNQHLLKEKGIELKFVKFDYGTSQTRIISIAKEAVQSDVIAVVGYNYSSHALIAAPIHFEGRLPLITPSATANRLSAFGGFIHPTCFNNSFMGSSLAKIAKKELKANNVAIVLARDCAYCKDLSDAFTLEFKKVGGKVELFGVLDSDNDFSDIVRIIKSHKDFDAIVVPNHELTSAKIISAIVKGGIKLPFIGGDGWGDVGSEFFRVLDGAKIEGYTATHWHPNIETNGSKTFKRRYKLNFNKDPNDTAALAYDAMNYLLKIIIRKKSFSRADLESSLNSTQKFNGITGMSFFEEGKAPLKSIVIMKVTENKFQYMKTIGPKE